jgi:NADPH:quinone reductase-like Zn-dependent oxidoreductase
MQAIVFHKSRSVDVLKLVENETPVPADDVFIKVHAASVNPVDYHVLGNPLLRRALFAAKLKITRPGRDVEGPVEAFANNVTPLKPSNEVFGA